MAVQCHVKHLSTQQEAPVWHSAGVCAPTEGGRLLVDGRKVVYRLHAARSTWNVVEYTWMGKVCTLSFKYTSLPFLT